MDKRMTNMDTISLNRIAASRKLLIVCVLLLASFLLSSCEGYWQYNANLYRMRDFTSAVEDEFGDLSIKDIWIDDEEKSFSMTYVGPETIAEFDQIREIINDYLLKNPDFFLNGSYSITVYFDVDPRHIYYLNEGNMITNRKSPFDDNNGELYENLAFMEISNGYEGSYEIPQIEGHCTTLKGIALDDIPLDDVEVLKNLPELESVQLISGYSNSERYQLQLALPECKVTSVRQST